MKTTRRDSAAIDELAARWVARRDAGLTGEEERAFSAWCGEDQKHAAAVARFERTWNALARPRGMGVAGALQREIAAVGQRRRRRVVAAGSVTLLALVIGWLMPQYGGRGAAEFPASAVLLMPERRTLPDGSIAELTSGATLSVEFSPGVRRVRLSRGEALFQVTKDATRPFVVVANGVEVRAVGTAFMVQVQRGNVEVLVTEGRVAVEKSAPEAGPMPAAFVRTLAFVDAGNRVTVDPTAEASVTVPVRPVSAQELDERLAWRAPRVEFSGTPLAEVVSVINRYATERQHPRFVVADEEIGRIKLSGLFRVDDTAGLVQMFEENFGLKGESRGENDIVLRRAR